MSMSFILWTISISCRCVLKISVRFTRIIKYDYLRLDGIYGEISYLNRKTLYPIRVANPIEIETAESNHRRSYNIIVIEV